MVSPVAQSPDSAPGIARHLRTGVLAPMAVPIPAIPGGVLRSKLADVLRLPHRPYDSLVGRRWDRLVVGGVSVLVLVSALTACGSSDEGTVTGVAAPCVGLASASEYAAIPVRISLQGDGTLTTETVHGRSNFRLTAPSGNYLLSSDAIRGEAEPITLTANKTIRMDLIPTCK